MPLLPLSLSLIQSIASLGPSPRLSTTGRKPTHRRISPFTRMFRFGKIPIIVHISLSLHRREQRSFIETVMPTSDWSKCWKLTPVGAVLLEARPFGSATCMVEILPVIDRVLILMCTKDRTILFIDHVRARVSSINAMIVVSSLTFRHFGVSMLWLLLASADPMRRRVISLVVVFSMVKDSWNGSRLRMRKGI